MKISQREARRLRQRVEALERREAAQANRWSSDWPGGVWIASTMLNERQAGAVSAARSLGHAVVCQLNGANELKLFAVRLQAT